MSNFLKEVMGYQNNVTERKNNAFDTLLEKCKNRIRHHAKNGHLFCIYQIPPYTVGLPIYNQSEACTYLFNNIIKDGFKVQILENYELYISWDSRDISKSKIKNYKSNNKLIKY